MELFKRHVGFTHRTRNALAATLKNTTKMTGRNSLADDQMKVPSRRAKDIQGVSTGLNKAASATSYPIAVTAPNEMPKNRRTDECPARENEYGINRDPHTAEVIKEMKTNVFDAEWTMPAIAKFKNKHGDLRCLFCNRLFSTITQKRNFRTHVKKGD